MRYHHCSRPAKRNRAAMLPHAVFFDARETIILMAQRRIVRDCDSSYIYEFAGDIVQWLAQQVGAEGESWQMNRSTILRGLHVRFAHKHHALMFKIAWSGC